VAIFYLPSWSFSLEQHCDATKQGVQSRTCVDRWNISHVQQRNCFESSKFLSDSKSKPKQVEIQNPLSSFISSVTRSSIGFHVCLQNNNERSNGVLSITRMQQLAQIPDWLVSVFVQLHLPDPDQLKLFLEGVTMMSAYRFEWRRPLKVLVVALCGKSDSVAPLRYMKDWRLLVDANLFQIFLQDGQHISMVTSFTNQLAGLVSSKILKSPAPSQVVTKQPMQQSHFSIQLFQKRWESNPMSLAGTWNLLDLSWLGRVLHPENPTIFQKLKRLSPSRNVTS